MTPPPFDVPRPESRRSLDPVRFCAMTTVALIAWIVSPPVFDKYHFAWNKVYGVPPVIINSIATGPDIAD